LINFLTMAVIGANPGWEWSMENAGALFGTYAMLLYITPIAGGIFADKVSGYRIAVAIGAAIMALGHISMAFETQTSLYVGLGLLVVGTGFFKPNITSIISEMYKDVPAKKDGAYTIFYMGVNAGAFFGMMLCGYLAERIGWSWGFGLASIFMILGTLQFWWAKPLFGNLGGKPEKQEAKQKITEETKEDDKENPFTLFDKVLIAISSIIGIGYAINDPLSKIADIDLFRILETSHMEGQYIGVLFGLAVFLVLVISRITRYAKVTRDRMIALIVFMFFTVFFWMSFEQGASSLIIFARDNVNRVLTGNSAIIYNIINSLLTIIPLGIISYVVFKLFKETSKKALRSNIVLVLTFTIIWGIVGWMLNRDWTSSAYNVEYSAVEVTIDGGTTYQPITENFVIPEDAKIVNRSIKINEVEELKEGQEINIITKNNVKTEFSHLTPEKLDIARQRGKEYGQDNGVIPAKVVNIQSNQVEITTSWFSILNSFFIIALASLFSKWWDSKYNPPASVKYGLGLIIMALGFGLLALGAHGAATGVKVSMIWLYFAYLLHTMGELCLSPVGLSYVSKLVPARMIAFMFGMFYLAIAIGNKMAAVLGGQIENITEQYSLSTFFLIFTIVPIIAGLIVIALNPLMKKLMHGIR
ncbi:MAG: peptide MFS transporter, partial [Bacteroidales bacterium]|jgi:POT family proton-dependent oligopeptide transporter|nr:peptide MFS transporter [Bacteroidales bacterium]